MMVLKYRDKTINIKYCNHFFSRFKGMMFLKQKSNIGYLFNKCNSIHTFFCFQKLDIYMLDKDFNILYVYKNIKPFRVILPKRNVYYTLEFSSGVYNFDELKFNIE